MVFYKFYFKLVDNVDVFLIINKIYCWING